MSVEGEEEKVSVAAFKEKEQIKYENAFDELEEAISPWGGVVLISELYNKYFILKINNLFVSNGRVCLYMLYIERESKFR